MKKICKAVHICIVSLSWRSSHYTEIYGIKLGDRPLHNLAWLIDWVLKDPEMHTIVHMYTTRQDKKQTERCSEQTCQ